MLSEDDGGFVRRVGRWGCGGFSGGGSVLLSGVGISRKGKASFLFLPCSEKRKKYQVRRSEKEKVAGGSQAGDEMPRADVWVDGWIGWVG